MVNEVVMYQSMFVLGVLMFGFFAATFSDYSDYAESITLDNNLDRVLEEINSKILDILDKASKLRGTTGTVTLELKLALDAEYANEAYIIRPLIIGTNVSLQAIVKNDIISELPLLSEDGTDFNLRMIQFSGSSISSRDHTGIIYTWDSSTGLETLTLF